MKSMTETTFDWHSMPDKSAEDLFLKARKAQALGLDYFETSKELLETLTGVPNTVMVTFQDKKAYAYGEREVIEAEMKKSVDEKVFGRA